MAYTHAECEDEKPGRIQLNRIKVDVKNELAEYRDATAAFWRRLRFYSIIIIRQRNPNLFGTYCLRVCVWM